MPAATVKAHMAKLLQVEGLSWPAAVQPGIVTQLLRGCKGTKEFMNMVKPYSAGEGDSDESKFDPCDPTLGGCEISTLQKAKVFQRMVVHERLIPMISRASQTSPELRAYGEALVAMDTEKPDLCPILTASLEELGRIGKFLLALFGGLLLQGTAVADLDNVMVHAPAGPLSLVKTAVLQNPALKNQVQKLRATALASKTMAPEMQASEERLQALQTCDLKGSTQALKEVAARLPAWDDALPSGSTASIVAKIQEVARQALQHIQEDDCDAFISFSHTMKHVQERVKSEHASFFKSLAEDAQEREQKIQARLSKKAVLDALMKFKAEDSASWGLLTTDHTNILGRKMDSVLRCRSPRNLGPRPFFLHS